MNITQNERQYAYDIMFEFLREKEGRIEESTLETALFIEDTFNVKLSDDEISPKFLGSRNLIIKLVEDKLSCAESAG